MNERKNENSGWQGCLRDLKLYKSDVFSRNINGYKEPVVM